MVESLIEAIANVAEPAEDMSSEEFNDAVSEIAEQLIAAGYSEQEAIEHIANDDGDEKFKAILTGDSNSAAEEVSEPEEAPDELGDVKASIDALSDEQKAALLEYLGVSDSMDSQELAEEALGSLDQARETPGEERQTSALAKLIGGFKV